MSWQHNVGLLEPSKTISPSQGWDSARAAIKETTDDKIETTTTEATANALLQELYRGVVGILQPITNFASKAGLSLILILRQTTMNNDSDVFDETV